VENIKTKPLMSFEHLKMKKLSKKKDEKMRKAMSKFNPLIKKVNHGIIMQKSHCCGATIVYTTGGIMLPICSKCKKVSTPPLLKQWK